MLSSEEVEERRPWWHERCPECDGDEFVTDLEAGEVACRRCGLVLQEEMLDQSPEWRAFTPEEREESVRLLVGLVQGVMRQTLELYFVLVMLLMGSVRG